MTKVYKTEDGNALRFFYDTDKNNFQSEQQGRPIFDKVLNVEVLSPASKDSVPIFTVIRWITMGFEGDGDDTKPVTKERRNEAVVERFRSQLRAFLDDSDDPDLVGTPLSSWPALDVAQIAEFNAARIFTVEALAALPDSRLQALGPGMRALRERASAFLEAAKGNAVTEAQAAEVANLREQVEMLQAQVLALGNTDAEALRKENEALKADMAAMVDKALEDAPTTAKAKEKTRV